MWARGQVVGTSLRLSTFQEVAVIEWIITLHDKVIKRLAVKEGWKLTIGRGADADVIVDNTAISRKHATLERKYGFYLLSDLGSKNGTFVNGKKVDRTVSISKDDNIELGKFRLSMAKSSEQQEALSYAVHQDTDDKTIFISAKDVAATASESIAEKPEHRLTLIKGQTTPGKISLEGKNSLKIGKASSCDMILSSLFVAGAQCYIIRHNDKFMIVPQRSWARTFLNGRKIKDERPLRKGDIIRVRSTEIRFD